MVLYIKTHMIRSPRWVAVSLVLFAVLIFHSWYDSHMLMKQMEIEDAYDHIVVKVELTNISGTSTIDLGMMGNILIPFFQDHFVFADEEYQGVDAYIKEKHLELGILYQFDEGTSVFNSLEAKKLKGVSNLSEVYAFQSGTGHTIRYVDGYDDSLFDYVPKERREPTCIIPETKVGNAYLGEDGKRRVRLSIAPHADPGKTLVLEFVVAGTHDADEETIYCPFILADALYADLTSVSEHDAAAFLKEFMNPNRTYPIMRLDALSAVVKDNRKISELRELLEQYYHKVDISMKQADKPLFDGNRTVAYMIYDEQLNRTVGLLNKNLRTLQRLFPAFLFFEIAMVFVAYYLYFHTRKRELALSRILGCSQKLTMTASIIETLVMCLPSIVSYIVVTSKVHVNAMIVAVATAITGTVISVFFNTRIDRVLKWSTGD